MGKSPGKWIKTVLFGKKSSKSNISKGVRTERKAATKPAAVDFDVSPPVILDASCQSTDRIGDNGEPERGLTTGLGCGVDSAKLDLELLDAAGLSPSDNAEREKIEQAATKAQAAFRGYLARRAFRALRGIIRLQALIRGHLVRRQAIATLRCMESIVKFQALARGRRIRLSNPEVQQLKDCRMNEILRNSALVNMLQIDVDSRSEKLATNAFTDKLLALLPTTIPLSLQYDLDEPNAAWNWLERWSNLRFWKPLSRPKKIPDIKSQLKQGSRQTSEVELGKSRRTFRKVATVANGDANTSTTLEVENPRRNARKPLNPQVEAQPEQPQNELERVKRNLTKVSASAGIASEKLEGEVEKPQQNARKAPSITTPDSSELVNAKPSEKPSDLAVVLDKVDDTEASLELLVVDEHAHVSAPAVEQHFHENDVKVESNAAVEEESSAKEDQAAKEHQKTRRRKSLPTKQEYPENVSQNTPSFPSYMAATESAKAKLRAQGSMKLSEDGIENGSARRHSLPPSTNGKMSSLSPRLQKPAQANGKGGSKSNKSLSASKDERVLQPGWQR